MLFKKWKAALCFLFLIDLRIGVQWPGMFKNCLWSIKKRKLAIFQRLFILEMESLIAAAILLMCCLGSSWQIVLLDSTLLCRWHSDSNLCDKGIGQCLAPSVMLRHPCRLYIVNMSRAFWVFLTKENTVNNHQMITVRATHFVTIDSNTCSARTFFSFLLIHLGIANLNASFTEVAIFLFFCSILEIVTRSSFHRKRVHVFATRFCQERKLL